MTILLDQQWQDSCLPTYRSVRLPQVFKMKPVLRVSPDYQQPADARTSPDLSPSAANGNQSLLSPSSATAPSVSPRSPSFKQRMHLRVRSLSGAKGPTSARQKWDRLSDADRDKSERFVKDAVAMCGLAGYSWKKTYEYLHLATELPLDPKFVVDADDIPPFPISESTFRLGGLLDKKPSANSLLTPESASRRSSVSRPETASSATSTCSTEADLKPIIATIRQLFETMQQTREPLYVKYVNMPDNNLKKMHEKTVAAHRVATLKDERSSLMDAIDFDRKAEKAKGMELAVAKLRFEMELSVPEEVAAPVDAAKASPELRSISSAQSTKSSIRSLGRQQEKNNMRSDAIQKNNNRISGVPTIITTVSDMSHHLRHLSIASSLDRPDSPASAKSEGHVQATDTWRKLQEAKARFSRRSTSRSSSRPDGVRSPGAAQTIDEHGFFGHRPTGQDEAADSTPVAL